jgi:hypothetical protein
MRTQLGMGLDYSTYRMKLTRRGLLFGALGTIFTHKPTPAQMGAYYIRQKLKEDGFVRRILQQCEWKVRFEGKPITGFEKGAGSHDWVVLKTTSAKNYTVITDFGDLPEDAQL